MAAIVQPLGEPTFEDTHREIRRELEHGLDAMGKEQPGLAETCYAAALERASALAKEALEMFERVEGEPVVRSNGMATALSQAAEYGAHGDDARGKATALRRAVDAYDAAATTIEGSENVGEGLLPALWNCADARLKAAEAAAELDDVGAFGVRWKL